MKTILLLLVCGCASARELHAEPWIVENGKPRAEIVIATEPTRSARLGATELQSYLEKISGARLEIVSEPTKQSLNSIFVGESEAARAAGVKADGLARDAYHIVSGPDWLALVGNDLDFQPREPWARNHGDWAKNREVIWEELAGHPWKCPVGTGLYRDYSKQLDIWTFDHRGSLNAVYAFLRDLDYTPFTNRGGFRPQYWPHVAARGIRESHEEVWREDVWLSSGKGGLHHPGMAHLNPYIISRFWWDADQDVDVLLAEYYERFYGPAAAPMRAFIEHCEREYARLASDGEVSRKALDLFAEANAAALPESVYGQRIALVDEFLIPLRARSTQMAVKRPEGLPEYRIIDMGKDKWRDARDNLKLDGKLDDPFWTVYDNARPLRDLRATAGKPKLQTRFHVRWMDDHLYFGIRCELPRGETSVIGSRENNDPAIWQGEHLELLIETDKHSYYQIVINPAGAMVNIDRGVSKANWYGWSAQAEVATHVGDDFWSMELKLPVTSSEEDPLHQIVMCNEYFAATPY